MKAIFTLLILFQLKHFICDYPLQTEYMLGKFSKKFLWPLTAHCAVHATATFYIVLWWVWSMPGPWSLAAPFLLGYLDFVVHWTMDLIKAQPVFLGRFKPLTPLDYRFAKSVDDRRALNSNKYFWWSLGLDQMVHHLTHYFIIWCLIT